MKVIQKTITLGPKPEGYHIITDDIESRFPEMKSISAGVANVFILHTSASLTINENADPSVRADFHSYFKHIVPEDLTFYRHTAEGPDDMTSHIKSSLLGSSLTIPVKNGKFYLGTWQGIYLCEHRTHARARSIVVTITGE